MNVPITKIATIVAILASLSGFGLWVFDYHSTLAKQEQVDKLVTKAEVNVIDLDNTISIVELKVLMYTLAGVEKLGATSKIRYDRALARLVNLEAQRDKTMAPSRD